MSLWPGGTEGTKTRELKAHATLYAMYCDTTMATDDGISAGNIACFGGIRLTCHCKTVAMCFRICTMHAWQVSDSSAILLLVTADVYLRHA